MCYESSFRPRLCVGVFCGTKHYPLCGQQRCSLLLLQRHGGGPRAADVPVHAHRVHERPRHLRPLRASFHSDNRPGTARVLTVGLSHLHVHFIDTFMAGASIRRGARARIGPCSASSRGGACSSKTDDVSGQAVGLAQRWQRQGRRQSRRGRRCRPSVAFSISKRGQGCIARVPAVRVRRHPVHQRRPALRVRARAASARAAADQSGPQD